MFLIFLSKSINMEAHYKDFKIILRNVMLAIIFMGFLMIIVSSLLSPDADQEIKETLKNLGVFFAITGLFFISLPYLLEALKRLK